MKKPVSFKTTTEEATKIAAIVARATGIYPHINEEDTKMDITATHANGCPLDLDKLLAADDSNFLHDVIGIIRHIDRRSGQLINCFLPRYALPEATHADD
ncbi:MAG: hypothetical protein PHC49_10715 [Desulfuromonadaceae bacterium]|nr:hypothetical protein [Desulfuromonadaceae bacterium]